MNNPSSQTARTARLLNPPEPSSFPDAYREGYEAVAHNRPLYAPRNPYHEDGPERDAWDDGAIAGGVLDDYTNGVRNDGKGRL